MSKPKGLACDRCGKSEPDVAGVYPFTFLTPYDPASIDWKKHEGIRMLCEDCYEYVTDAMLNVWPPVRQHDLG